MRESILDNEHERRLHVNFAVQKARYTWTKHKKSDNSKNNRWNSRRFGYSLSGHVDKSCDWQREVCVTYWQTRLYGAQHFDD